MPEPDLAHVVTLLWVAIGLLLLLLLCAVWILRRLGRVGRDGSRRRAAAAATPANEDEEAPNAVETSPGGAFEAFLAEDPGRRKLTKGEQFKSYRKWRQEKGLNWKNS